MNPHNHDSKVLIVVAVLAVLAWAISRAVSAASRATGETLTAGLYVFGAFGCALGSYYILSQFGVESIGLCWTFAIISAVGVYVGGMKPSKGDSK